MVRKNGRPTRYTNVMGEVICQEIRSGKTLGVICEPEGMPHRSQVYRWLSMPSLKSFRDKWDIAIVARADAWAEEAVAIADDGANDTYIDDDGNVRTDTDVIQRSKLRVTTRLSLMGKVAPRKYGDKIDVTSGGENIAPLKQFDMSPAAMAAMAAARQKQGK